ncbi:hypothetical protein [Prescottella sp. R16]|uniref:hypothetical protein n=1 Tax=Prescottella sp. R16 TaxID=3064529 RepID=UPI00272E0740|nr:hypothetical protein [Prescottella sp. R16]
MTTANKSRRQYSCPREGCPGKSFDGKQHCSYLCQAIAKELESAQRICEFFGDSELTTEIWTEAVALSDDCSRYLELGYQQRIKVLEAGITPRQWQDIRKGRAVTG